jgi:predicted dehydrogenase
LLPSCGPIRQVRRPQGIFMTPDIRFALIGGGFIGRSHALAIHAANLAFPDLPLRTRAHILAEGDEARARDAAARLGFDHWTASWEEAVDAAQAVVIAVPGFLHFPIAERVLRQGKPLLCEKPVGLGADEARQLAALAETSGSVHAVGFTYVRLPLVRYAKSLLDSGRFGRILQVRGRHFEDYLADPSAPHGWRLSRKTAGRFGALGDLGYHIIAILRFLCGPIAELSGLARTFHAKRPAMGGSEPVENEDYASATLVFENGAVGVVETSRVALGRKMEVSFEIVCEGATIVFDAERMNELRIYEAGQGEISAGFRTVLANASHPDFAAFLPAPGHQIGFNDLKTIEIAAFMRGIAERRSVAPDLHDAARISAICDAILDSSASGRRIARPEEHRSMAP